MSLPEHISRKAILNFAGEFPECRKKIDFLSKINGRANIIYHGPVQGRTKTELLWKAHIFCLPSSYEAQPISILEAYAAGCTVLTTDAGGIKDIFKHGVNGYWISRGDKTGLRNYLELLILGFDKHKNIALHNYQEAIQKYTESRFNGEIEGILLGRNL